MKYLEITEVFDDGRYPRALGLLLNPPDKYTTDRVLGSSGMAYETLTENLTLQKGCNTIVVRSSPQEPRSVLTILREVTS